MGVPDAVQHEAHKGVTPVFAGYAEWCTAGPGPFQTPAIGTVPGLQRTTASAFTRVFDALWKCCAAPGTSEGHECHDTTEPARPGSRNP
jgi:hypothetical protein